MTATSARIGFVLQPYRRAVAVTSGTSTRHGNLARETADPLETWFADLADAQTRANERQALLSPDRRRFGVIVADVEDMLDYLSAEEVPTVQFYDEERDIDMLGMATELVIDIEAQRAAIKVWG